MVGFEFDVGLLDPFDCRKELAIDKSQHESERLAATIEQVVWRATAAAVKGLRVELLDGQVILSGHCRTYYIKQIAQHAAMEAAPGSTVVNRIVVA